MTGPDGRRVYISADMEGVTGLVDAQDVQPGGADYERGRVMMTEDVNAAVNASAARPCCAIGWPSKVVATDQASPGMLNRIDVMAPPNRAPQ